MRPTVSIGRAVSLITSTAHRSRSSPAAWPRVSLTSLKWSRSRLISPNGRPWRSALDSSASKRSSKPRRLRQPVSGSARETRDSASRRRSWLRACQPHSAAVHAEAQREEPRVLGIGPVAGDAHGDVGDVVECPDRDHGRERIGERGEDHRHEEHQRERAGRPAVRPGDRGDQRDLRDAPQQEERLAPAAAHHALVRDQHEQQRDDRADAEQRRDQLAVGPVPGGGHVEPAGGAQHQREAHAGADALGACANLGEVDTALRADASAMRTYRPPPKPLYCVGASARPRQD